MRVILSEYLQSLGVKGLLDAYETFPWSVSDAATGKTCSAEVRMNDDGREIEAEIQLFYDNPAPGQGSIDQILWFKAEPSTDGRWETSQLRIKRADWAGKVYGWEDKCRNLFRACVIEIEQGKIPDFDKIIDREMAENERFGGSRGGGGKAPKIKPQQLLNMKQGGF